MKNCIFFFWPKFKMTFKLLVVAVASLACSMILWPREREKPSKETVTLPEWITNSQPSGAVELDILERDGGTDSLCGSFPGPRAPHSGPLSRLLLKGAIDNNNNNNNEFNNYYYSRRTFHFLPAHSITDLCSLFTFFAEERGSLSISIPDGTEPSIDDVVQRINRLVMAPSRMGWPTVLIRGDWEDWEVVGLVAAMIGVDEDEDGPAVLVTLETQGTTGREDDALGELVVVPWSTAQDRPAPRRRGARAETRERLVLVRVYSEGDVIANFCKRSFAVAVSDDELVRACGLGDPLRAADSTAEGLFFLLDHVTSGAARVHPLDAMTHSSAVLRRFPWSSEANLAFALAAEAHQDDFFTDDAGGGADYKEAMVHALRAIAQPNVKRPVWESACKALRRMSGKRKVKK